jgi:NADH:ubiquinone oxidoreductase subunit B-like Fe-S oxidoreductase
MATEMSAAVAPDFILDRRDAVPVLIGRHEDFLIVAGLAGTSRDVAALTRRIPTRWRAPWVALQ